MMNNSSSSHNSGNSIPNENPQFSSQQHPQGRTLYEPPVYSHESIFRSENMQLSIRCPDSWVYDAGPEGPDHETITDGFNGQIDIPVFGANDLVGGTVLLSPMLSRRGKGKLSISIEGTFTYISPHLPAPASDTSLPQPLKHEHVFFAGNMAIATYPPVSSPSPSPTRSRRYGKSRAGRGIANGEHGEMPLSQRIKSLSIRNALRTMFEKRSQNNDVPDDQSVREVLQRAQTTRTSWVPQDPIRSPESTREQWTSHGFSFPLPAELPSESRMSTTTEVKQKRLPPSFSTSHVVHFSGVRGRAYAENAEVSYRVIVEWGPLHQAQEEPSRDSFDDVKKLNRIEAPFLFEPIADDIDLDIPLPDGRSAVTDQSRKSKKMKGTRSRLSRATSITRSGAMNVTRNQMNGKWNDDRTETIDNHTILETEPTQREWADFSMDTIHLIPGERKPPPFKAMLTLPYPCSYNRIGAFNTVAYTIFFATYSVYDFLVSDIRRHSEITVELVRRIECDGRKGAVPAVVPAPDPIPEQAKPRITPPKSPTEGVRRRRTFFSRITVPLLRRRASALPTDEAELEEEEQTVAQPKYITPEKLLPPVPPDEEGGVMIEETVIGREMFTGWLKGPEEAIQQKKNKKSKKRKSLARPEEATTRDEHRSKRRYSQRTSIASVNQLDVQSEAGVSQGPQRKEGDPQGFIYGKFKLDKSMIVSLCWEGLRVEYFMDVEIRYGGEALACRAAIEIYDSLE